MKKYIFMAVAAIAALSSCSSDNDLLSGETGKKALTFTATMEGSATRATYDSGNKCASWETTDQISVNGKTYNAQSAGLTTTFKAATPSEEAEGPTYNAYFACSSDGETATLPAEVSETWANGKFNMPMYATSDYTNLEFKNLCGVLKITVKSDQIDAVKSIKVSSANKAVSGAFTVYRSNAAVLSDAENVSNTLTVTYTEAVRTTAEGVVFYVAVPAQTYQELKLELDADGNGFTKSMTTKSALDIDVERSKIYPITFADKAAPATTGIAEATINGSTVNVNWVQLWEDGPKFAEYNVGASRATDRGDDGMTFRAASDEPFFWGANWCTPSKADMNELFKAASDGGSTKVTCVYGNVEGVCGFTFTGVEPGYTTNSVFFPCMEGDGNSGHTSYWAGPAINGERAWQMYLKWAEGWDYSFSRWDEQSIYEGMFVRPVLRSSSNTTGDDQNSNSVTFKTSDFEFNGSEAVAEKSGVRIALSPIGVSWGDGNQFEDSGSLIINVQSEPGVTITKIVYTGSEGSTTKTDKTWNFDVTNGYVMDGSTNLGNSLVSITVNYTIE